MPGGEAGSNNGNVQCQFEDLLSLVLARSRGEVENDDVENALSSIVAEHVPPTSSSRGGANAAAPGGAIQRKKENIIPDEGNYDDDSEEDDPSKSGASNGAATKNNTKDAPAKKVAFMRNDADDATTKKVATRKNKHEPNRLESIDQIPLGKMGEKMLVTFGDGPVPEVEVISAALLGTRMSLQRAILDARALRRREKDSWHQARVVATMHRTGTARVEKKEPSTGIQNSIVDNELVFRAMDGYSDNLRYDRNCGFDIPQLNTLFPEEMRAYQRWKEMHDEYSEKSGDDKTKSPEEFDDAGAKNGGDEENDKTATASRREEDNGGRLMGRLANFDARTNKMGDDWYLKFADVRKGSFLPRYGDRKQAAAANYHRGMQKDTQPRKRGRPSTCRMSWNNLHPTSIIFLHWIGFDPKSALAPPNEETTHALGFLAYDFFGKIVEKAVSLRLDYDTSKYAKQGLSRSDSPLLELTEGDQIEKENMDQALAEVDLSSLYSSTNIDLGKSAKVAQLYFGPGFEDRLELEMDEIFGSKEKVLTQEEMKTRQEEEHMFSELPEVPNLLSSVTSVLDEEQKDDANKDNGKKDDAKRGPISSSRKKRRTKTEMLAQTCRMKEM